MSSPPSLEKLKISENTAPAIPSTLPGSSQRPPSPSPTPGTETADPLDQASNSDGKRPEDTPPYTPAAEIPPIDSSSQSSSTSAAETTTPISNGLLKSSAAPTSVPAPSFRPPPASAGSSASPRPGIPRGGMTGPMGMRAAMGRGGSTMQARIPASLQAKMDAVVASRAQAPPQALPGGPNPNATSMSALLRSQALGGGKNPVGPNAGPLGLAARRAAGGPSFRPSLGAMGAPTRGLGRSPAGPGGVAGRRGPPGGLTLSGMKGGPEKSDSKFSDFGQIM
ncbi:hypothetical protein BD324DRAFT_38157 [Kockovaella imperatae]|uniref:Uncharacterized protein n=1 Tax=Kockovaella imperatae TaxID=4999 RepID=A0A1Y1USV7_9TREE|nr:hypothetical protein BD324DRAFT_38157 [Kockovaella imperatae]ORX41099.1 hypothetical protein BD324DRAFT_38157 [Kockovaella imperatae]